MKKAIMSAAMLLTAILSFAQPQNGQPQNGQPRPQGPRPEMQVESDYPTVHDPVVAECDGKFYVFSTGFGVSIMVSDDMKVWKNAGSVFQNPPQWALDSVPGYRGHTWAPDILHHNGTWYLFYSCSSFGKNSSAIGVATNTTLNQDDPAYKWVDHGQVIASTPGKDDWNAIDPNAVIDDDGNAWLCFGSFWSGIKMVKLDKTLTKVDESQPMVSLCYRPANTLPDYDEKSDAALKLDERGDIYNPGNGAVEAPFIYKKLGWYYLFVSYDLCCRGEKSTYKVVVGRSKDIKGPYYDKNGKSMMEGGGTIVVQGNARYAGAGHSATVDFGGWDYLFFHAYDMQDASRSHLIIREINWDDDNWPSVKL